MKVKKCILEAYFLLRLPYIWFLRLLFRVEENKPEEIKKILIIRTDRMGDFILTLPVIDNLRLRYPQAEISIIVRPYLKKLAELIKAIDNVIVYSKKIPVFSYIRRKKYDLAMDMLYDYKLDSAFLAFVSGAPIRVGFSGGYREILFNYFVNPLVNKDKDIVDLHLELLRLLGIPVKVTVPKIEIENRCQAEDITIAIHPGGYYESQRWQPEKFILLAKKILDNYRVKILVIGSDNDRNSINRIIAGIDNKSAQALFTDMKELAYSLSKCRLLICNHSGPLHLASALGVPTVSSMGPTDPVLWSLKGDNNVVIRKNLECSPCSRGKCGDHKCMDLITVEEMFEAVKGLMEKKYGIK